MRIKVCVGSACHLKGSYDVIYGLQDLIEIHKLGEEISVVAGFCLGNCCNPVSVVIDNEDVVHSLSKENLKEFFWNFVLTRFDKS